MVDHPISNVGQGAQRGFLREVMKVRMIVAAPEKSIPPRHSLDREIQRDVKQLVFPLRSDVSHQAHVIFHMLKHIEHEQQIEEHVNGVASHVTNGKVKIFIATTGTHLDRDGRDIVAPASAVWG